MTWVLYDVCTVRPTTVVYTCEKHKSFPMTINVRPSSFCVAATAAVVVVHVFLRIQKKRRSRRKQGSSEKRWTCRIRHRRSVLEIFNQLGDPYFRRAYRMTYSSFGHLALLLSEGIILASGQKEGSSLVQHHVHNGRIMPEVRLAGALRWFAGGSAYDIMTTFGISHSEVFSSLWFVVEAVNNLEDFEIIYPADHIKQRQIADGFLEASAAGFECCAGAIDGILIWIHKPSDKDCALSGCDPGKFFCGRKHKFGLNCQAVCDARGRILDMAIQYPGSTSDILAFEGMSLYDRLEDGLLAPGLCLFGDNAYLNTPYMATPYSAVSGGSKDSYNFYHSQVRIRIECTFGILTHRWAILRSAIPMSVSVKKTVALVCALGKLHNFCIDTEGDVDVPTPTPADEWEIEMDCCVPLVPAPGTQSARDVVPEQLLDGGNHFDDLGYRGRYNRQRRYEYMSAQSSTPLPRERLHDLVCDAGLTRPIMQV